MDDCGELRLENAFLLVFMSFNAIVLKARLSIESPDVVALVRKMLIYKSKLCFFGLRAPNQKPL